MKSALQSRCLIFAVAVFSLAACASAPNPTLINVAINVHANANPDMRNRPSPVVVKFYELKSLAAFSTADFFSIFDRDKETLGAELLARDEFQLQPGDKLQFDRRPQAESLYVGVIAAFRDLEHAEWRAALAISLHKASTIDIELNEKRITMVAAH